jgi:hypothetical protein
MSCQRGGTVRGKGGCGRGIRALTMDGDEASVLLALDVVKAEATGLWTNALSTCRNMR